MKHYLWRPKVWPRSWRAAAEWPGEMVEICRLPSLPYVCDPDGRRKVFLEEGGGPSEVDVTVSVDGAEVAAFTFPAAATAAQMVQRFRDAGVLSWRTVPHMPSGWHWKCAWELRTLEFTAADHHTLPSPTLTIYYPAAPPSVVTASVSLPPRMFISEDACDIETISRAANTACHAVTVLPFAPGCRDIEAVVGSDVIPIRRIDDPHRRGWFQQRTRAVTIDPAAPTYVLVHHLKSALGFSDMAGLDANGAAVEAHAPQAELRGMTLEVLCGAEHWGG